MNSDVNGLGQPKPQMRAPEEQSLTQARKSSRLRFVVRGCAILLALLLIGGCVSFYVILLQPRFFAATQTLQVTQPVCGTWQAMSGSIFGPKLPRLDGLAVVAKDDIWGIGSGATIHHWNGSQWNEVTLPQPSANSDVYLSAIAVLPDGEIWAVGSYKDANRSEHTLTYHFTNGQWILESSPQVGQAGSSLNAVSGTGKNDVWATGIYEQGDQSYALALHWDGTQWSQVAVSNECSGNQNFYDVLAFEANDVWAVGDCSVGTSGAFTETIHTEVQHWDGLNWKVVPDANHKPGKYVDNNSLDVISGTSSNDIWAIGNYLESDGSGYWIQPMMQHWNGLAWNEVQFMRSSSGLGYSNFSDIVAISPDNVWALGYHTTNWLQPFGIHWDGKQWSEVPVPNPLAEGYYTSLSALGSDNIWATGFGFDNEDAAYYGILARFESQPCPAPSNP